MAGALGVVGRGSGESGRRRCRDGGNGQSDRDLHRGGHRYNPADERHRGATSEQLGQPGDRPQSRPKGANRDAEHRSDDDGVEMAPRTARQLSSGHRRGLSLLIGADGGHDIKCVGYRHYARPHGDLLAFEAVWVARTVPALVVFQDGACPRPEPFTHWPEHLPTNLRVLMDDVVFVVVQGALFVEDLGRYGQLANVVEQGGPIELVERLGVEAHFVADQAGVGTHALRMAPGRAIVGSQGSGQFQDALGRLRGGPGFVEALAQLARGAGP